MSALSDWQLQGRQALVDGKYAQAVVAFERAAQENPGDLQLYRELRFARTAKADPFVAYLSDPKTDGIALLDYARNVAARLPRPRQRVLRPGPRRPGRLRIGFLSPDFRRHSCAFFLRPLFENRDRTRFEFHCFADFQETKRDALSDWFQSSADRWTETTHMTMPQLAESIREAAIDILVDVGGFSVGSTAAVCAYKPARKIVSWLGFAASTGIREIDYRLGDAIADPPGSADAHFSERVVRLDGPFICYSPDPATPPVAPVPVGEICFGTFNAQHKINVETARLWAQIVARVPGSRLALKCRLRDEPTDEAFLRSLFAAVGFPPERLTLSDFTPDLSSHLGSYASMHIALDTFPYNGTTTTCEALWMGVPVVVLCGERHAARVGASLLHHAGLSELIAPTPEAYADLAVSLALDRQRLGHYRAILRSRVAASLVNDAARWTRLYEACLVRIFEMRPIAAGEK